jgi:hypothetical protein
MPPLSETIGKALRRQASRIRGCLSPFFCLLLVCVVGAPPASAFEYGRSLFFATREACYSTMIFRKSECDNAFANAIRQVEERTPLFGAKYECQARFQMCGMRRVVASSEEQVETVGYGPDMLGVEIFNTPGGIMSSPVLAIANPPGLFVPLPVSRVASAASLSDEPIGLRGFMPADPQSEEGERSGILRADRFQPFSFAPIERGWSPFKINPAQRTNQAQADGFAPERSVIERKEKLKSAPFIE